MTQNSLFDDLDSTSVVESTSVTENDTSHEKAEDIPQAVHEDVQAPLTLPPIEPPSAPPPEPPRTSIGSTFADEGDLELKDHFYKAYLNYAHSVVNERALPSFSDGQKPVQRKIIYAMHQLGLAAETKAKKSARIVGDVIGKYHPHGDSPAYEALVRMAQDFSLRYPLIIGQGNFGTRDGDGAAAMRYTESKLSTYAELMLGEINAGAVNYGPNYDGTEKEPLLMPARLPFLLLNGSSGIAVGMATKIPSHNMTEVGKAAIAVLNGKIKPTDSLDDQINALMEYIPGPDFPGAAQIISSKEEIANVYKNGRGSVKLRGKFEVEKLTKGQWRLIISELPYEVSAKDIVTKLLDMSDPKIAKTKKELSPQQKAIKQLTLEHIDLVRDESGKEHHVRIVIEPRSSRVNPDQLIAFILKNTDLESSFSVNLTMIGIDGKPAQKNLFQIVHEWTQFRTITVTKRTQHRLEWVEARIHILEGRIIAFLNIDKIIKVIRDAEEPHSELMQAFDLTDIQATDILEIRLRQLARLEGIKIEKEANELRNERDKLNHLLQNADAMRDQIVIEINADLKKYGDDRRTLIELPETYDVDAPTVPNEVTSIVLSKNGWLRQRFTSNVDISSLSFKDGDALHTVVSTRTINPLIAIDSTGRAYTLPMTAIPSGKGDGVPVSSMIEMPPKNRIVALISSNADDFYLFYTNSGYGFRCKLSDIVSRQKAGKAFMKVDDADEIQTPVLASGMTQIASLASTDKMIVFPLSEMKELTAGKGVTIQGLGDGETIKSLLCLNDEQSIFVIGNKLGKDYAEELPKQALTTYATSRAKKGKLLNCKFEINYLSIEGK